MSQLVPYWSGFSGPLQQPLPPPFPLPHSFKYFLVSLERKTGNFSSSSTWVLIRCRHWTCTRARIRVKLVKSDKNFRLVNFNRKLLKKFSVCRLSFRTALKFQTEVRQSVSTVKIFRKFHNNSQNIYFRIPRKIRESPQIFSTKRLQKFF